ncbi:hypothetical protein HZI73_12220 [Vallitalea pronyensis]|uniref:Uncharacterized protein n=1 Tax=Vallitalea pronyensis TaxID=1348613 RepID=A0A8J8SH32_9FIRM|nr:hypothetical protein [Vallitalea pronyensis]QUI23009.1 hypothetical protein HZI73_12220 [Vallitalea pronyensis]
MFDVVKYKLNQLIDLMITDGVQPSDLVDNIFNYNYSTVNFYKHQDCIVGEVCFDDENQTALMRYIYNVRQVIRIEEEVKGKITICWDRGMREKDILNKVLDLLVVNYSKGEINQFTLPENLATKLKFEYLKIA